jgi:hypothetical protein
MQSESDLSFDWCPSEPETEKIAKHNVSNNLVRRVRSFELLVLLDSSLHSGLQG